MQRLAWIGHVVRIDRGRRDKKIFESEPVGSRRKGRPGLRWLEDTEENLWEMKKVGS
jgi:hypothetical protein